MLFTSSALRLSLGYRNITYISYFAIMSKDNHLLSQILVLYLQKGSFVCLLK